MITRGTKNGEAGKWKGIIEMDIADARFDTSNFLGEAVNLFRAELLYPLLPSPLVPLPSLHRDVTCLVNSFRCESVTIGTCSVEYKT